MITLGSLWRRQHERSINRPMASPHPLTFEPILKEKVWGGRRLARYGKLLPAGRLIGESWEIADLGATSPGGGGGEAARSVIANGPLAGSTLHQVIERWGRDLIGSASLSGAGEFPLLVKFLDARENLSVQVHPSPGFARAHPDAHLKTEAWIVVEAEPGSMIYAGLRAGVGREDLEHAARRGEGVAELLERVEAVPGDCHLLPSGTVHALGAGVLVLEIQTASDTTFRLHDWGGRSGRELHVDKALECATIGAAPAPTRIPRGAIGDRLCVTEHFDIWSYNLAGGSEIALEFASGRCAGVVCAGGSCEVRIGDGLPVALAAGGVSLVPAAALSQARVVAMEHARIVCFGVGAG